MAFASLNSIRPVRKYLDRIGAAPCGLLRARIVLKDDKYERDVVIINFSRSGAISFSAPTGGAEVDHAPYAPTPKEEADIVAEFLGSDVPTYLPCEGSMSLDLERVPRALRWPFLDRDGKILMVVVRTDTEAGKEYRSYTYWSDGVWRVAEPDGLLPLYGAEKLFDGCSVMIHEGPKAARAAQEIAADEKHPWNADMKDYVHVGWHGGAGRPFASDWSLLSNARRVVICPDNDRQGMSVVRKLSALMPPKALVLQAEWDADFPEGWDVADELPRCVKTRFGHKELSSYLRLATLATEDDMDRPPRNDGVRHQKVREIFLNQWFYVSSSDEYVYFPSDHDAPVIKASKEFDNHFRVWSTVDETSKLMKKAQRSYDRTAFLPGRRTGVYNDGNDATNINVYTGTKIVPARGDMSPFLEFLSGLLPVEWERLHVQDWLATLIARPGDRSSHAILLSGCGGTGKSTLAEFATQVVGEHNTQLLTAETFENSIFSGHLRNKVLVVIPEVYCGANFKVANKMKGLITDARLEIHSKGKDAYNNTNTLWFIASSNDAMPIRLDEDDRRWFIPETSNRRRSEEEMEPYYQWFRNGGAGALLYWAQNYKSETGRDYLPEGMNAPATEKKKAMIESSQSKEIVGATDILRAEINKRKDRDMSPNFTFSLQSLYSMICSDGKEKLSFGTFKIKVDALNIAHLYKTLRGPNGSDQTVYYVGEKPLSDKEMGLITLIDVRTI